MKGKKMTPKEFDACQQRKHEQFMTIHWPRAEALLKAGKTPNEVAEIMDKEGYWGRSSDRFSKRDLQFLSLLAAEFGSKEKGKCQPSQCEDGCVSQNVD